MTGKQPANLGVEGAEEFLSTLPDYTPTVRPPASTPAPWQAIAPHSNPWRAEGAADDACADLRSHTAHWHPRGSCVAGLGAH